MIHFKVLNAEMLSLNKALTKPPTIISAILKHYPLGRLAFRLSVLHKQVGLLFGLWSQRAIEYPWVLSQVKRFVRRGSRILDVGCAESLLSHELIAMGYEVWGIDINDYPFKPKYMRFVKGDVRDTGLPRNFFDAIVCVSTIEHIGLPVYGQKQVDLDGDVRAIRELHRILKYGGYLFLTTPFAGRGFRLVPGERQYDVHRLELLMRGFEVVEEQYFIPLKIQRKIVYVQVTRNIAKNLSMEKK